MLGNGVGSKRGPPEAQVASKLVWRFSFAGPVDPTTPFLHASSPLPPSNVCAKKLRSPRRTSFWGPNLTQACPGVLTGVRSFLNSLMWSFLNSRLNSHWLFRGGGLALLPTTKVPRTAKVQGSAYQQPDLSDPAPLLGVWWGHGVGRGWAEFSQTRRA